MNWLQITPKKKDITVKSLEELRMEINIRTAKAMASIIKSENSIRESQRLVAEYAKQIA